MRPEARNLDGFATVPMPAESTDEDGWCLVDVELPAREEAALHIAYRAESRWIPAPCCASRIS